MNLDAEPIIRGIVESMLPRWSDPNLALGFGIDISYSCYKHDEPVEYRRLVHFLFVRPHNYTQVYVNTDMGTILRERTRWNMTCDHDSCWSSDGIRILHEIDNQAMKFFEDKGIAWQDVHVYASFGLAGEPKYFFFKERSPIGEQNRGMSLSYHRDWEIHLETMPKEMLYFDAGRDEKDYANRGSIKIKEEFLKGKGPIKMLYR